MVFKHLAIAAAFVVLSGLSLGQASAQPNPDTAAAPAAAPATPDAAPAAPADANAAAPAGGENKAAAAVNAADQPTPYGLTHIWMTGTLVSKFIIVVLGI